MRRSRSKSRERHSHSYSSHRNYDKDNNYHKRKEDKDMDRKYKGERKYREEKEFRVDREYKDTRDNDYYRAKEQINYRRYENENETSTRREDRRHHVGRDNRVNYMERNDSPLHSTSRLNDLQDNIVINSKPFQSIQPIFNRNINARDQYLPSTTESLHAKKLAALDHEKFLIDRQRERDSKGDVGHLIWPQTPPRSEFYFGDIIFNEKIENNNGNGNDNVNVNVNVNESEFGVEIGAIKETTTVEHDSMEMSDFDFEDKFGPSIKIKAPSAPFKPNNLTNLNSFSSNKNSKYGSDLMPGEGSAMAGFVAQGQRIPRRGEIGLESTEISRFESAGFVMSGSRHHMMNAVRMRKENQVISAEEKTMISQMAIEERIKREEEIVKTFKTMVDEKFKQNKK